MINPILGMFLVSIGSAAIGFAVKSQSVMVLALAVCGSVLVYTGGLMIGGGAQ